MSQHTPGPWGVVYDEEGRVGEIVAPCHEHVECHKTIAFGRARSGPFQCSYGANEIGNARLIAAAPDLLDALRALREAVKAEPVMNHMKYDALGVQVNKAIAKAEGGGQ